jgi:hypothetical protein
MQKHEGHPRTPTIVDVLFTRTYNLIHPISEWDKGTRPFVVVSLSRSGFVALFMRIK